MTTTAMTPDVTPSGGDVDVVINSGPFESVPEELLRRAVLLVLSDAGVESAEISITLLADDAIQDMNREYLSKDRPTDVIAFSLGDDAHAVGDVYVGHDQARRQARELAVDLDEELARLAIHGTLHTLGHDHPDGDERLDSPMFALQERILAAVLSLDLG